MEYPEAVRSRFDRPAHLAAPGDVAALRADAGRVERGAAVELLAWPDAAGTRAERVRFRAFGCPWLVATADLAAERLTGAAPAAFEALDALALGAEFDVPPERNGRLLLVADAAAGIARRWHAPRSAGHPS